MYRFLRTAWRVVINPGSIKFEWLGLRVDQDADRTIESNGLLQFTRVSFRDVHVKVKLCTCCSVLKMAQALLKIQKRNDWPEFQPKMFKEFKIAWRDLWERCTQIPNFRVSRNVHVFYHQTGSEGRWVEQGITDHWHQWLIERPQNFQSSITESLISSITHRWLLIDRSREARNHIILPSTMIEYEKRKTNWMLHERF